GQRRDERGDGVGTGTEPVATNPTTAPGTNKARMQHPAGNQASPNPAGAEDDRDNGTLHGAELLDNLARCAGDALAEAQAEPMYAPTYVRALAKIAAAIDAARAALGNGSDDEEAELDEAGSDWPRQPEPGRAAPERRPAKFSSSPTAPAPMSDSRKR